MLPFFSNVDKLFRYGTQNTIPTTRLLATEIQPLLFPYSQNRFNSGMQYVLGLKS